MLSERSAQVVVMTNLSLEIRNDGKMFAAYLDAVGITGYGRTIGDARDSVKRAFRTWVEMYRELGVLEERLDQIGVTWFRADEYSGEIPVEDTTCERDETEAPRKPLEYRPLPAESSTALAA